MQPRLREAEIAGDRIFVHGDSNAALYSSTLASAPIVNDWLAWYGGLGVAGHVLWPLSQTRS